MVRSIASEQARRRRGVGYCTSERCPEFLRLSPQVPAPEQFRCTSCGTTGALELDRGVRSGEGPRVTDVRMEFGFDPRCRIYRQQVAVRAARALRSGSVFTLQTPLLRDAAAAYALGAALLRQLSKPSRLARAVRRPVRPEPQGEAEAERAQAREGRAALGAGW
jgi:hypothetical protein